ncbi:hypothetical protein F4Y93_05550 [Candidatus Poribacteria bacterium]|nr:hypothetical protein [Candidatus Poribacteria bacterium]
MKGFKEISEQIRDSITRFIEAVDDTESALDKTVVNMKARLAEAKDLVATAIAEEQRLKRAYQAALDSAEIWGKKADAALQMEDLEGANDARQRHQQHLSRADDYKRQMNAQAAVVARLKTALHDFYHRFQDAVKRAETLYYRQKQTETRTKLYKLLFDEINNDVSKAFKQAEQKLKATEVEADVWERKRHQTTPETETTGEKIDLDQALRDLKNDILGSRGND